MPKTTKYRLKQDGFRKARGGRSTLLDLSCDRCGKHVALYQKDGPGPLKRLYLDRIQAPTSLVAHASVRSLKRLPALVCSGCGEDLGIPMIYKKEDRFAFKLFQSVLVKKKHGSRSKKST